MSAMMQSNAMNRYKWEIFWAYTLEQNGNKKDWSDLSLNYLVTSGIPKLKQITIWITYPQTDDHTNPSDEITSVN